MNVNTQERLRPGDGVVVTSGIHKGARGEVHKLTSDSWSGVVAFVVKIGEAKMTFAGSELSKTT
jgi:ribosomal protein L24